VCLRIEGRVQGVGFRAFVEREALRLGIDGYVLNRRDGGVEVIAAGPPADIDELIAACRRGPRGARVDFVRVLAATRDVAAGFVVAPTR
jgi:acylphosphatase